MENPSAPTPNKPSTSALESEIFVNQLISWYDHQKRDLPWRQTDDPYKIWLSEIILQQTRVKQGMPYYLKFIEQYPTVNDLATAPESEVLRLWQGLGYYSRARNLHACAKTVSNDLGGEFPSSFEELLKLKGIGRYTAAAIASIAFNKPNAVVDGNVYRVLSRVFGIEDDISNSKTLKIFETKANTLIDKKAPGEFNQAIMDFGAIQCTPKSPACAICPMSSFCYAFNTGKQEVLPVKTKKVKVRNRFFYYYVYEFGDKLLMKERGPKDVWQGLYDFSLLESPESLSEESVLKEISIEGLVVIDFSEEVKHVLTHQRIFARFIRVKVKDLGNFEALSNSKKLKAFELGKVQELPKPILIQNYLQKEIF
ncbi:A/G-specific adenine glycosylase [Roseivirga sp. E12]|uniref:A/G-specific adenine glycosylase n=1 Tax=Roseivirga sp. E12 TaxID=2819237 RepID=UPI001ABD08E6|nr:A/G-specific adenine glycosylase [Roseivirga sp. E12]MBO3699821.1 A/G-specific adenine glycosylase [Roseivirga sp. E12]